MLPIGLGNRDCFIIIYQALLSNVIRRFFLDYQSWKFVKIRQNSRRRIMTRNKFTLALLLAAIVIAACDSNGLTVEIPEGIDPQAVELTHNEYFDGILTSYNKNDWYTFKGDASEVYQLKVNSGGSYGDGTKTGSVTVSAYTADGTLVLGPASSMWTSLGTINTAADRRIFVSVSGTGSYALKYFDPALTVPQQETSISTVLGGPSWITISWGTISDADAILLYRSETEDGKFDLCASLVPNLTSYNDMDTQSDREYYYKLALKNRNGEGAPSKSTSAASQISATEIIPLPTDGTPVNGTLASNGVVYYSFSSEARATFTIRWNDRYDGDGSKSADIYVAGYLTGGGTLFARQSNAWTTPQIITASGTVYLMVTTGYSGGSYSIGCEKG
jgi:hypothetical protein